MLPFYKRTRTLSEKTSSTILSMDGLLEEKADTAEGDTTKSVVNDEVANENEVEDNADVPENTRKLKIKRKFSRSAFTKLNNKLLAAIEADEDETLIKGYMVNLQQKFEDLKAIECQIQDAVEITELEEELNGFQSYEEKFEASVLMVTEIEERSETASNNDAEKEKQQHIKFPTIKLEKFSGRKNTMEFAEWFELFNASSQHLKEQDRTILLKSLLLPPASSVLAGIRITGASYELIIQKLFKSYGSDKILINRYLKRLLLFQPPPSRPNQEIPARNLRRCYDELNNIIRNLLYVDSKILTSERLLVELLLLKTPQSLQLDIELSEKSKDTIEKFFSLLDEHIVARESASLNTLTHNTRDERDDRLRNHRSSLIIKRGKGPPIKCIFCGDPHLSRNCEKPKVPPQERFALIWKMRLCSYCILPKHMRRECKKQGLLTCRTCGSNKHITALHNVIPNKAFQNNKGKEGITTQGQASTSHKA